MEEGNSKVRFDMEGMHSTSLGWPGGVLPHIYILFK